MAVNDPTTNYGWDLPDDAADLDAWGDILNQDIGDTDPLFALLGSIDTVIFNLEGEIDTLETRIDSLENRVLVVESLGQDPVYARLSITTADPVGAEATPEDVDWDTEEIDVGGMADLATNPERLTIPAQKAGIYQFRAHIRVQAWRGGGDDRLRWTVKIIKNNTDTVGYARSPYQNDGWSSQSGFQTIEVECLDNAGAGDFYEVEVEWDDFEGGSPASFSVQPLSYFEAVRLPSPPVPTVAQISYVLGVDEWQTVTGINDFGSTTVVLQDGEILYRPFQVHRTITVDQAAFRLSSAMSDETNVRIGIYQAQDDGTGRLPDALLGETGDINLNAAAAGTFTGTFGSPIQLLPGTIYYVAIGHNRVSGTGGITCTADRSDPEQSAWHFGHDTASAAAGASNPRGKLFSNPTWGPGMPDPADLTGQTINSASFVTVALHRSA